LKASAFNTTTSYENIQNRYDHCRQSATVTRIENQLRRFVDVVQVDDLTNVESIHREMILVRLNISEDKKAEIKKAIDTYKWKVLISSDSYAVLEITGDKSQIDFALARLEPLE